MTNNPCLEALVATSVLVAGCAGGHVSVGELPCDDRPNVLCAPHEREGLSPIAIQTGPDTETAAEIVWRRELPFSDCGALDCAGRTNDFLVHHDGEVTVAGIRDDGATRELQLSWFDADGQVVFEQPVPDPDVSGRTRTVTQLTLGRDTDGAVLLLIGLGTGSSKADARGLLRAYAIDRQGQVEARFEIDTGETWPGPRVLTDGDVVVSRSPLADTVEIARYTRQGEQRWRQIEIARVPTAEEIGLSFDSDIPNQLREIAVDDYGRIWATVSEGVLGVVQLDPDGIVAWHGLLQAPAGAHNPLAIDSYNRPIVGVGELLVRIEPDASDEMRAIGTAGFQEHYYPQSVDGLDLDAEDRMYIATQDGPFSHHRLLIERVSSNFRQRDRFVLPLTDLETTGRVMRGLQLAPDGAAHVRIVPDGSQAIGEETMVEIVRVHLPTPEPR